LSIARPAASAVTGLTCRTVGRRRVIRAARFVLRRACLDVRNDMHTNGELALQRWALGLSPPGRKVHVIDVGANLGHWSEAMIAAAREGGRPLDLDLHVFEPSAYTFRQLTAALKGPNVKAHQLAVSDGDGTSLLHVVAPGAGTNSLHAPPGVSSADPSENVMTITLDSYAERAGADQFDLVKVDTEGHDLAVLRGARELFARHRISIVQFEYNHRWIYARSYLRDVFELLTPLGYRIGKLTPAGVEFYPHWDPELETFIEGNYVACRPPTAARLPVVSWWKGPGPQLQLPASETIPRMMAREVFVMIKRVARLLPGARQASMVCQRVAFAGSARYWDQRYAQGGTSGGGSYGAAAIAKAEFLSDFVHDRKVGSVIEFGCGDGHQLSLARYPRYIGLDVSCTAIKMCKRQFPGDLSKSFFLYDGACFVDHAGLFRADMAISLDVIYHLVEDRVFETYMEHFFAAADRYAVVYATNQEFGGGAAHVRHRHFSSWVEQRCPAWKLAEVIPGPNPEPLRADFFVYQRTP
jgi:FkbM family methyltransferase